MAAIAGPMTIAMRSSLPARLTCSRARLARQSGARHPARAPWRVSGAATCVARATPTGDVSVTPGSDVSDVSARASLLRRLGEDDETIVVGETVATGNYLFAIAAKAKTAPNEGTASPSAFQAFGRTYWPFFLVLQTLALVGAAISGVSSRKKRVELKSLNEKLRQLADRDDENACAFDWDNLEGQCTDSWPGAEAIASGTEMLKNGNVEAALEAFQEARAACEKRYYDETDDKDGDEKTFSPSRLTSVSAAAYLAATKGYASCLTKFGGVSNLKTAVKALQSVEVLAKNAGDETVYGAIADALTDLGDFAGAGSYYDKVLEMD
jgi:tetratricopeptide (TPR) repeat protein